MYLFDLTDNVIKISQCSVYIHWEYLERRIVYFFPKIKYLEKWKLEGHMGKSKDANF